MYSYHSFAKHLLCALHSLSNLHNCQILVLPFPYRRLGAKAQGSWDSLLRESQPSCDGARILIQIWVTLKFVFLLLGQATVIMNWSLGTWNQWSKRNQRNLGWDPSLTTTKLYSMDSSFFCLSILICFFKNANNSSFIDCTKHDMHR